MISKVAQPLHLIKQKFKKNVGNYKYLFIYWIEIAFFIDLNEKMHFDKNRGIPLPLVYLGIISCAQL